jgi:hypothetical protein
MYRGLNQRKARHRCKHRRARRRWQRCTNVGHIAINPQPSDPDILPYGLQAAMTVKERHAQDKRITESLEFVEREALDLLHWPNRGIAESLYARKLDIPI